VKILFIVDGMPSSRWSGYRSVSDPNPLVLLLCSGKGIEDAVNRELTRIGARPTIRTAAGDLDRLALQYRDDFTRMVTDAPSHFFGGGEIDHFGPLFEGRLALWWLDETTSKRSDSRPTYSRFCQIQLVRETILDHEITEVRVMTRDLAFWDSLSSLAHAMGVVVSIRRPERRLLTQIKIALSVARAITINLVWFVRTALQTMLAKVLLEEGEPWEGHHVFYTHFPNLWKRTGRDEKYEGVPIRLSRIPGVKPMYACSFSADGRHQGAPLFEYASRCRWVRAYNERTSVPVHVMDRDLKLWDFLRAFWAGGVVARYLRILLSKRFRNAWKRDGVDFSPLFVSELREGMQTVPRHVLSALRVRRFLEKARPVCFVHHLFEFGYGRALVYGVRTAQPNLPIVGVQQGPVTRRQLQYHRAPGEIELGSHDFIRHPPTPDGLIIESEAAREILVNAGFDDARMRVAGAPRLGAMTEFRANKRAGEMKSGRPCALVVFSPHDSGSMLAAVLPAMDALPDFHFVFKLHPRGRLSESSLRTTLGGLKCRATFEIAERNVYDELSRSDILITTYSSVGIEAATLGIATICIQLPDRVNVGQLLDLDGSHVLFVTDTETLVGALTGRAQTESSGPVSMGSIEHVRGAYGAATEERWASLIQEVGTEGDRSWLFN